MRQLLSPLLKRLALSFTQLKPPLTKILDEAPKLLSRCNRPLQMEFEDQLNALIFFHLEEHSSGRHLIQSLHEDDFAREHIAPKKGIAKSSFFEAMNERGLEQFFYVFEELQKQAAAVLPQKLPELEQLVSIDGSLIDAVLSMAWADYRRGSKKAKAHIGFDINRGIPRKIFLTAGNGSERPFSARSWRRVKPASLIAVIRAIKTSTFSRLRTNTSFAGLRRTPSRPAWKAALYQAKARFSVTRRSFLANRALIRVKNLFAWSDIG